MALSILTERLLLFLLLLHKGRNYVGTVGEVYLGYLIGLSFELRLI